jgi:gamma-glutamyltranspeptidase/glutathione hydrolase/leukotriene-C4 hydrolase
LYWGLIVNFFFLQEYNLSASYIDTIENKAVFYHRLLETFKHAFAKRSYLGDMDFVDVAGVS